MGEGNVTYLFLKPNDTYHNSESFWTSLFAIYIHWLSQSVTADKIVPAYQYQDDGKRWSFKPLAEKDSFHVPAKLSFSDIVMEGGITEQTFDGIQDIDNKLYSIKPDIIIQNKKKISLIEVKKRLEDTLLAIRWTSMTN